MTAKDWIFLDENIDETQVRTLCTTFNIPQLAAKVMVNRGYGEIGAAARYLGKNQDSFHEPMLMADMDKAVARIRAAINGGEKITVYGDYDVDGITSVALMVRALRAMGANVGAYIPDRQSEGYGVNRDALKKIAEDKTTLVITVDTGITAADEAEYASEIGLDMIITDHHECKSSLPNVKAVVNPKRPDCSYPFKELAGVGVAFKVICALAGDFRAVLDNYGDIIALGTIADVVSLTDENRAIADYGIKKMLASPNPGLKAVIDIIGSGSKWNSCAVVSYSIAPRLNAAGRMSSAMTAVELLLTEDPAKARLMAERLDVENRRRQSEESLIFDEAVDMINKSDYFGKKVLVLAKRGWHHGIIGVVASRLSDRFNKSCILISVEDEMCKSSGRSVDGMNLFDALSRCSDILEKFGGHAYAAGFSIKEENIPELERRLNEYADEVFPREPIPRIYIDAAVSTSELTLENVRRTDVLCPYGAGNKTPVFAIMGLRICDVRTLSGGKHSRFIGEKDGRTIEIIAFGMGPLADEVAVGDLVDAAGELNINVYNDVERVQLVLADMRSCRIRIGDALPSRDDFADIYRYIKPLPQPICAPVGQLAKEISARVRRRVRREKLLNALAVFADVGIISLGRLGDTVKIQLAPNMSGKKFNLSASGEYIRIKEELERLCAKGENGYEV